MTDKTKRCYRCKEHKPIEEFYKNRAQKDGRACDCKKCHLVAIKQWRDKNPDRAQAYQKKCYRKRYADPATRKQILDKNVAYNKSHRKQIAEWQRKRRYVKLGRPVRDKSFVFYRDVIKQWMTETLDISAPKWKQLLSLPLTEKQRELVELTIQGMTVAEVSRLLKRGQSNTTKMWNGDDKNGGGIYTKVKRWLPHLLEGKDENL